MPKEGHHPWGRPLALHTAYLTKGGWGGGRDVRLIRKLMKGEGNSTGRLKVRARKGYQGGPVYPYKESRGGSKETEEGNTKILITIWLLVKGGLLPLNHRMLFKRGKKGGEKERTGTW